MISDFVQEHILSKSKDELAEMMEIIDDERPIEENLIRVLHKFADLSQYYLTSIDRYGRDVLVDESEIQLFE